MSVKEAYVDALPEGDQLVRNPDQPNHLMVVKPVGQRITIFHGEIKLAQSDRALRVMEVGGYVYDPMIYLPKSDLTADLDRTEKTSVCPLKGNAHYFSFNGEEVAWGYAPYSFSAMLEGHVAFWPQKVRLVEGV